MKFFDDQYAYVSTSYQCRRFFAVVFVFQIFGIVPAINNMECIMQ